MQKRYKIIVQKNILSMFFGCLDNKKPLRGVVSGIYWAKLIFDRLFLASWVKRYDWQNIFNVISI